MKGTMFSLLAVFAAAASLHAGPRTAEQRKVEAIVASSETLRGAVVSAMAMTFDGDTLMALDCDRMLVTASNMKLITTGTALHRLGGDFRFRTGIGYCGRITDGRLDGDVVIVGGGDPTLGSRDSIAVPSQQVFASWKAMLSKAGIRSVGGKVIGDGGYFEGPRDHQSWQWEDIGTDYGTGGTGLSWQENVLRFYVQPGPSVGSPVSIRQTYPSVPRLKLTCECTTGEAGTGDRLYLFSTDFADRAVMTGTYALGKAPKTLKCSNKQPELTCAAEFASYLASAGIPGGKPEGMPRGCGRDSLKMLGTTYSPSLRLIAKVTNNDSNNFYAETLARMLGKTLTGNACYDSASVAVQRVLADLGLSTKHGARIVDGSGLSRENYVSPAFFCKFLAAMKDSPAWDDFLSSLPQPGVSGTIKGALSRLPMETRRAVHMKSGAMNGVRCYSGYYLPDSGRPVIFSVMVNNCTAKDSDLKTVLDSIITAVITE